MKIPKVKIDWAFVDVKRGRKGLAKIIEGHDIPVTLTGTLTCLASGDDGVSVEFEMIVDSVSFGKPTEKY